MAARDDWIRILTVAINMSDIEPDTMNKHGSVHEGILQFTRQGHTRRCHATLIKHVVFFLKSLTDPSPVGYVSVKGARIRELTDNHHDHQQDDDHFDREQCGSSRRSSRSGLDCNLAIYPRYSLLPDPVYLTLGGQRDADKWFHHLSMASGLDQLYGTEFEQTLTKIMVKNSVFPTTSADPYAPIDSNDTICSWEDHSVMMYTDRPITKPLTSLPNETLRVEAVELFKSILLFTQVPIEPTAIDYHVCLLQNCFERFLKYPELRNELFAQLIKQTTYVLHRCQQQQASQTGATQRALGSAKSSLGSSDSSGCSPNTTQRSSFSSAVQSALSRSPLEGECCQLVTDMHLLESIARDHNKINSGFVSSAPNGGENNNNRGQLEICNPLSQTELVQAMQILAIAVSLHLPRGRMRWWLADHLDKFADSSTRLGKYALYTLRAIERASKNGSRDNVPSRMELLSILSRNPYDHSSAHSFPVTFCDATYIVLDADGSTTVEELMASLARQVKIRPSNESDFYLFSDEPSGRTELHILEPQRKVLDIVGWWEQTFRRLNSGRYQNTKAIRFICKKRLLLRAEPEETERERLYIVHQLHQEVLSNKIPLSESLTIELASIMAQLNYGPMDKNKEPELRALLIEKANTQFLVHQDRESTQDKKRLENALVERWQQVGNKSAQDCVRIYLNCMRRLQLCAN